jgi:hypothetical protein
MVEGFHSLLSMQYENRELQTVDFCKLILLCHTVKKINKSINLLKKMDEMFVLV